MIIQRRYPAPEAGGDVGETTNTSESSERVKPQQVERTWQRTHTIFCFEEIKRVATDLDFSSLTQKMRGKLEMEIPLHNQKNTGVTIRYAIFDLANRIMAKLKQSSKQRYKVLCYASKVIFYDNSSKAFCRVNNLDRLWSKHLTLAYEKGNNTNPLQAKHKGSAAYTDKLKKAHPGYIRELFRTVQKELGNQVMLTELANEMTSGLASPTTGGRK